MSSSVLSQGAKRTALELSSDEAKLIADKIIDMTIRTLATRMDNDVIRVPTEEELQTLKRLLVEPVPQKGASIDDILYTFQQHILPYKIDTAHRRFFAFVPGPASFISALGEFMVHSFNIFGGTQFEAAGPTIMELATIRWLCQIVGLPDTAGGTFVPGGTTANWTGLAIVRNEFLRDVPERERGTVLESMRFYYSAQTHHSVTRSLSHLGFQPFQFRVIPTDEHFRIDLDILQYELALDKARGLKPACLIANAGATNTGAIDPIEQLAAIRDRENMWLHVDAAYGGAALLNHHARSLMKGIETANSITIDPHKWWFQTYGLGCLLVRHAVHLPRTFKHVAEYLEVELERPEDEVNFQDYAFQQTRNCMAFRLWLTIKYFGLEELTAAVNHGIHMAELAETYIHIYSRQLRVVSPAQIGIICFRYEVGGATEDILNLLNQRIYDKMLMDRYAMIHTTWITGKRVLRMCIIHPETTVDDVNETLRRVEAFGDQLVAEGLT